MSYSLRLASILNISSYLYLFVASLATTPTLIKSLGLPAFSTYALSLGVLALATSVDLGLSRSVVYYLAKSTKINDKKTILASSLLLHSLLGFTLAALAIFWFSWYVSLLIFITFIISHHQAYHESIGNFGMVNFRSLIIGTTNTLGASYLASLGYGVDIILLTLSLATTLTIFILTFNTPRYSLRDANLTSLKLVLIYGLKLQLGKLVNAVQSQYPKFIFASVPLALTIYSLASSLVAKAAGAATQIAIAFFPYSITSSNDSKHKRYYTYTQISLFILGFMAITTYPYYGQSLLYWWLQDGAIVTQLHTFLLTYRYYGLLLVLTPLASTVLDSHNRSATSSLYALYALLIEVAVVLYTLPRYGVLSIAYGSLVSLLVMVPVLLYATQKSVSPGDN
ncbi:MAG: hypothetical protein DPW11_03995 [bacterium]|nr:hypothetical protein [Candidatus Microgenomates bacterium CPR3]MCQ3944909.1 hypothetical protein [bacterium]RIK50998.1 MAG: hypothetical protein DCC61_04015 [Candidatus Microgenomates bacterium]